MLLVQKKAHCLRSHSDEASDLVRWAVSRATKVLGTVGDGNLLVFVRQKKNGVGVFHKGDHPFIEAFSLVYRIAVLEHVSIAFIVPRKGEVVLFPIVC